MRQAGRWGVTLGAGTGRGPPGAAEGFDAIMRRMDRSVGWRAALLQALLVTGVALVLAVALPRSFFEDWGWLAGPGAWGVCALAVAAVLRLPALAVLAGAAVAGLPMLVGVAVGVHWLGSPLALAIFAVWCARVGGRRTGGGVPVTA
jgi:hypothetical protein